MAIFPRYVTACQYNDYVIRWNIPHATYWHKSYDGRWWFKINSQGFRSDVDYSYQKPKDTLRVLVLGDSFTIGYEVAQEETYSAVLERELKKQGMKAEVINAGVSGFSNAEELVFLEQEGVRYQPDVVVLGYYGNDFLDNVQTGLFGLSEGKLVVQSKTYAPAAGIRDFLNSFSPYRWLSEHSYFHNYLNQVATVWIKDWIKQKRQQEILHYSQLYLSPTEEDPLADFPKELVCRLVERMRLIANKNHSLFILLTIPDWEHQFSNYWPEDTCSPQAASDIYVDGFSLLKKKIVPGRVTYRPHGHHHWTPISHEVAGKRLAELIAKQVPKREHR